MSLLFRLVYATHANGTHHKLALDALHTLTGDNSEAWRKVFLKHAELFLEGSKAPDKEFKDFRNHVLHVSDDFWGGAPDKVVNWYAHTVAALKAENWSEAVYAAGVLSHYYTDPIHPFHTAQSEAETSMHRAVEWSINKSYNELRAEGLKRYPNLDVPVPTGENWLADMACDGAETSHAYYEKLIAHYNLTVGVSDPKAGLDPTARRIISELLLYAAVGFGRILERAIEESGVEPPTVTLTAETFLATLRIPMRWVQKKMDNAEDKAIVQAMWDELQATGTVDKTLPEDDRMVRDLHRKEILEPRRQRRQQARANRVSRTSKPDTTPPKLPKAHATPTPVTLSESMPAELNASLPDQNVAPRTEVPTSQRGLTTLADRPPATVEQSLASSPQIQTPPTPPPQPIVSQLHTLDNLQTNNDRKARYYLKASDPVEDGPSIGPKTAKRLATANIETVQDLFDCNPEAVAIALGQRHITPSVIRDWQDQAELVINVPELRGGHAQLLVGSGYRDIDQLAAAEPTKLSTDVLKFVMTSQGERILRDGNPPDLEKITAWINNAQRALAA
ncbi:MAG: DUF4332 domain-containing protein [Hyphomicrobiaceae bacterium]